MDEKTINLNKNDVEPVLAEERMETAELSAGSGNESRGSSCASSKFWRKRSRARSRGKALNASSGEEDMPAAKMPTVGSDRCAKVDEGSARLPQRNQRGRFLRPSTPVRAVQLDRPEVESDDSSIADLSADFATAPLLLRSNKAEASAAKRAQRKAVALDEVGEMARQARERRAARSAAGEEATAVALSRQVLDGVDVVLKVATKSGNLKTTFTRALKEAAEGIKEAVEVLLKRTSSEETAKLWEENGRLRAELEDLKSEVATQKSAAPAVAESLVDAAEPAALVPAPAQDAEIEKIVRICMQQCGGMMNARLEALESRLLPAQSLRPPLAADRRRKEDAAKSGPSIGAAKEPVRYVSAPPDRQSAAAVTAPSLTTEAWTTVVKKKKDGKKKVTPPTPAPKKKKNKKRRTRKSRASRSAAVVITLQPGAVERGLTYKEVFSQAKAKVAFPDLGTPTGFRMKSAITGARLFEVMGPDGREKADILAAKLREVLKEEDVRVSRPVKTAELRVDGLDDSTTPEDVVEAVARSGGCPPGDIRAGEVRADAAGLGTIWLKCPAVAAKKVVDSGRLLVGWVAARVKLLQPRAMRCYRCLEVGHVGARCTATIDRSGQCYRCGNTGHRAAQCSAKPNCSLCTAAGRPAEHSMGGKACGAPAQQKGNSRKAPTRATPKPSSSSADSRPKVVEGMDCA